MNKCINTMQILGDSKSHRPPSASFKRARLLTLECYPSQVFENIVSVPGVPARCNGSIRCQSIKKDSVVEVVGRVWDLKEKYINCTLDCLKEK